MHRLKQPKIVCRSKKSYGLGYLVDLLCVTRIGKRAPKLLERRGYKMAVFSNDYIGILINQFGLYEQDELELLFEFLKPLRDEMLQGEALDIGANIGNHARYFSNLFSHVYAYEPNPDTYELLRINTKYSKNISTYNYGFGEEEGTFFLKENHTNIGGSHIVDEQNNETVEIQIAKLDNIVQQMTNIVFIKIDVEGFEEKVFKGGLKLIAKHQPIIVFEQDEKVFIDHETPSIRILRELGYRFCWQQKERRVRSKILRKFIGVFRIVFKSKSSIVTGMYVPKQFHSMLIAIPPRYVSALNLHDDVIS